MAQNTGDSFNFTVRGTLSTGKKDSEGPVQHGVSERGYEWINFGLWTNERVQYADGREETKSQLNFFTSFDKAVIDLLLDAPVGTHIAAGGRKGKSKDKSGAWQHDFVITTAVIDVPDERVETAPAPITEREAAAHNRERKAKADAMAQAGTPQPGIRRRTTT